MVTLDTIERYLKAMCDHASHTRGGDLVSIMPVCVSPKVKEISFSASSK